MRLHLSKCHCWKSHVAAHIKINFALYVVGFLEGMLVLLAVSARLMLL